MCKGLSEMRHVHRIIRNVTWDMCTWLSETWHETCAQNYQIWDMCTGLSEMWHEICAQGYQKCVIIHVHMVIRNETFPQGYQEYDMRRAQGYLKCDMRSLQGYQECDMRFVHRVIRNVTWNMGTGLSESWHETCAHGYQKSLFIMYNYLPFWVLYIYVYQATGTITYPLLSQITKFTLSHFTTQSLQ